MSRFTLPRQGGRGLMLLLTQTFPLVMVIPPIYRIMGQLGLTNSLIGLIIIYTAFNIAFATFLMQSFFDGIPKDLEEAAMIDGCTRAQALRQVIVPLTLPGMGATLGFVFTAAWSEIAVRADADLQRRPEDLRRSACSPSSANSPSTGGR